MTERKITLRFHAFSPFIFCVFMVVVSCQHPTNACFTVSDETATVGETISFDGTCSENSYIFRWNFGDGSPDTLQSFSQITHQYSTSGNYTVTLHAARKDGRSFGKDHPTSSIVIQIE